MISSPCSAEQAQRIKLCPRKSPPQSFPPIAQQAPGHFVRGLFCSQAAQPAAEAAGGRPASNEIDTESPRTAVRGLPLRFIQNPPRGRSRTAAGELEGARPASNAIWSFFMTGEIGHKKRPRLPSGPRHPLRRGGISLSAVSIPRCAAPCKAQMFPPGTFAVANGVKTWHTVNNFAQGGADRETQ